MAWLRCNGGYVIAYRKEDKMQSVDDYLFCFVEYIRLRINMSRLVYDSRILTLIILHY